MLHWPQQSDPNPQHYELEYFIHVYIWLIRKRRQKTSDVVVLMVVMRCVEGEGTIRLCCWNQQINPSSIYPNDPPIWDENINFPGRTPPSNKASLTSVNFLVKSHSWLPYCNSGGGLKGTLTTLDCLFSNPVLHGLSNVTPLPLRRSTSLVWMLLRAKQKVVGARFTKPPFI